MDGNNIDKTALVLHRGPFHHKMMPFELENAPALFQRAVSIVLVFDRWQSPILYIDGGIVTFKKPQLHVKHIDEVLWLLHVVEMKLQLKCHFMLETIYIYVHVTVPGEVIVTKSTKQSINLLYDPRYTLQLRLIVWSCNISWHLASGPAKSTAPLKIKL